MKGFVYRLSHDCHLDIDPARRFVSTLLSENLS